MQQFNTLNEFRHAVYPCFEKAQDALFELSDALLTEPTARTFAELSLSPRFRRRWPSLYAAVKDGQINRAALVQTQARFAPAPAAGQRVLLGLDSSGIARPESPTARDRTYLYVHNVNVPSRRTVVTPGWQFSSVVVLPATTSSWTYVLDTQRIPSTTTPAEFAGSQLQTVRASLAERPIVVADRYYGSAKFVQATATVACDKLLRIAGHRVFYRPAPPPHRHQRGARKKDGPPFKCKDARTHGKPTATWDGADEQGRRIQVAAWVGLHFRPCREITLTVIRVMRHGASGQKRDPKISWFIWIGEALLPLEQVWPLYRRRYGHDHGFRFDKQDLLWLEPRLRTPEQFQRWTDVVSIVRNEVVLARAEVATWRYPWESRTQPDTPRQVRRHLGAILGLLGTPARVPQPRGKSPGRARGMKPKPAPRFKVVYKDAKRNRNARK